MNKKFWRCIVCGDIHFGVLPPKTCPTCSQVDKYIGIEPKEAFETLKGLGYA